MTPEEIEALKKRAEDAEAAAEAARQEAETQKKAAEDAEAVNKTLQAELIKAGSEVKSDLPKVKLGGKNYQFAYATFKHNQVDMKASEVAKLKDEDLIKELIECEVLLLVK